MYLHLMKFQGAIELKVEKYLKETHQLQKFIVTGPLVWNELGLTAKSLFGYYLIYTEKLTKGLPVCDQSCEYLFSLLFQFFGLRRCSTNCQVVKTFRVNFLWWIFSTIGGSRVLMTLSSKGACWSNFTEMYLF
jgi:hypothetical protein